MSTKMPDNRSHFDLSHNFKTTYELGEIIPFLVQDVVPGDSFLLDSSSLIRLQPLASPVMDNLTTYMRYYFVPYRILDRNYQEMLIDPDSPLAVPNLYDHERVVNRKGLLKENNLLRALGISSRSGNISDYALKQMSQYFFRAYYAIYNYYFLNPLINIDVYIDNLDKINWNGVNILDIRRAQWFGDYFSETKPSTQYGTEVDIDLDGNNTVKVNELRLAEKLQKFRDKLLQIFAGRGSRYSNYLNSMFGVSPSNSELQLPLYIGGSSRQLYITDVDQTAPSAKEPVATTYGKSVTPNSFGAVQYDVREHGMIIGLTYTIPLATYQAGIPRSLIKSDYYDFYNPLFAQIGMQEVMPLELTADADESAKVFGYHERYADLKYPISRVAGDFIEELDFYHLARNITFEQLSPEFLKIIPSSRIFSVNYTSFIKSDVKIYYSGSRFAVSTSNSGDYKNEYKFVDTLMLFKTYNSPIPQNRINEIDKEAFIFAGSVANMSEKIDEIRNGITGTEWKLEAYPITYLDKILRDYGDYIIRFSNYSGISFKTPYYVPPGTGKVSVTVRDFLDTYLEGSVVVHNHVLADIRNIVKALRPIPKNFNPSI